MPTESANTLNAIPMFCFPKGISLRRMMSPPIIFSFILTREDGARVYGTTLVFDEEFPIELLDQVN